MYFFAAVVGGGVAVGGTVVFVVAAISGLAPKGASPSLIYSVKEAERLLRSQTETKPHRACLTAMSE